MVQFASYLRRVLCKTRLIFPRLNGPNVLLGNYIFKFSLRLSRQPWGRAKGD